MGENSGSAPGGGRGPYIGAFPPIPERTPQLSVVVPTRNEGGNIEALDQRLTEALAGIDYEVVVVDDSDDTTTRPALRATAQRHGYEHGRERGKDIGPGARDG